MADADHRQLADKFGLADYLRVSPRTIEKWTSDRAIPFIRISARCVRYDLDAIDATLAEKTVPVGGV